MNLPEDVTIGHRVMLTVAIIVIILLVLAFIGYLSARWDETQAQDRPAYQLSKFEPRMLKLERRAIDDAFRQKITSLWTVWMSDDRGQPARAIAGATQARKAYIASMQEIERREENLKREPAPTLPQR